jgi:hypothetical protein
MSRLKPWADSPFDLILHAENCYRKGSDFDRRIALIVFDNSIEVSISTYLSLNPIQRQNKSYQRTDVERWLGNYHTKLDFLFEELQTRNRTISLEKDELVWCHDIRNGQYHAGGATIPRGRDLEDLRKAAFEIFSVLFDVSDIENFLEMRIADLDPNKEFPKQTEEDDKLIDEEFGTIRIAGRIYYTSEAIYSVDPFAYGDIAANLKAGIKPNDDEDQVIDGGTF